MVEKIREESTRFTQTTIQCPGCDTLVWEAERNDGHWAGCHCLTMRVAFDGPVTDRFWRRLSELYANTNAMPGSTVLIKGLE
jgi:hypothetical protein